MSSGINAIQSQRNNQFKLSLVCSLEFLRELLAAVLKLVVWFTLTLVHVREVFIW